MIYFWIKKYRENHEPTVSYAIYTEVSYKALYIGRGVLFECVDNI